MGTPVCRASRRAALPHHQRSRCGATFASGLRLGDFRRHSVAYFFEPLLAAHDREQVDVVCYADEVRVDAVTQRFAGLHRQWRAITEMADADFAKIIREDAIDILVDLSGHFAELSAWRLRAKARARFR
jgi:predicted O-linked N-acetylglucosamine transferase (SPINDLY family)